MSKDFPKEQQQQQKQQQQQQKQQQQQQQQQQQKQQQKQQQQPEATTEETRLATSLSSPTDDADIEWDDRTLNAVVRVSEHIEEPAPTSFGGEAVFNNCTFNF